ncbi:MAG TPA: siroheme synthase CysG, partial [Steroidobacteraceae bacterium]|nr:siroheme synthase CysG [Steroidobacteraceae bacterium]
MDYFPIFLRLAGERVLVVGGGEVAARKIDLLLRTSAKVRVVAPELVCRLAERVTAGEMEHVAAEFAPEHLDGVRLAIAATDKHSINAWVARQAERRNIPVNVVDDRELSRFIMPAIIDRSPVVVAVGSSGDAPVLTRRLRERLESFLPQRLGALAKLAGKLRPTIKERIESPARRRKFWENFFDGTVAADVLAGRSVDVADIASTLRTGEQDSGEVVLVGAGPGDPGLLTLRALRALQNADVILYDRLVSVEVLDLARRDAERINVGKTGGGARVSQDEINALLVQLAQQGKRVCRLKGGDPFIFGRGGEELEALAAAGVRFEVVPGVTAAAGCAAYAGIPLTHRDHAQSLVFVTGHVKAEGDGGLDWDHLARP